MGWLRLLLLHMEGFFSHLDNCLPSGVFNSLFFTHFAKLELSKTRTSEHFPTTPTSIAINLQLAQTKVCKRVKIFCNKKICSALWTCMKLLHIYPNIFTLLLQTANKMRAIGTCFPAKNRHFLADIMHPETLAIRSKQLLISSCLSVRHSAWRKSSPTGRIPMRFDIWELLEKMSRKFEFYQSQ